MGLVYILKKKLGLKTADRTDIGCRAVKPEGQICGNDVLGQSNDGKIQFCSRHAPSDAVPYGRFESIEFYIPEEDIVIEKH